MWGRLAAMWAVAFAIPHILWGLGWFETSLRFSLGLAPAAREACTIREPAFIATGLWGVAGLLVMAALIALATSERWGRMLPRWMVLTGVWGVCLVLSIRGLFLPGVAGAIAIEAGLISTPEGIDPSWIRWNIVLWSPWFLAGAALFANAARAFARHEPA